MYNRYTQVRSRVKNRRGWLLDQLMAFDAGSDELEDGGETKDDARAVLSFDRVSARWVYRRGRLR